jgi:2,4-dienoyl-CoA reductase-like NADH-dependent reductase (Old Yellow Enzyme family)
MANEKKTPAQEIAELKAMVAELATKLEAATATPVAKKEKVHKVPSAKFEVNGQKYQFTVSRYIKPNKGGRVIAAEALNDPAELERLVSIGSTVVKPVK